MLRLQPILLTALLLGSGTAMAAIPGIPTGIPGPIEDPTAVAGTTIPGDSGAGLVQADPEDPWWQHPAVDEKELKITVIITIAALDRPIWPPEDDFVYPEPDDIPPYH